MELLTLRRPQLSDESTFIETALAVQREHSNFLHYYQEGMSFEEWLRVLDCRHNGLELNGHVPSTFYFGFVRDKIVGRLSIRHQLDEFLTYIGGHIGYFVVPEERRKGFATAMLVQSLGVAKTRGLSRVLLTCDVDNVGSKKTIENCGGVLENIVESNAGAPSKMRFWIDLTARG